MAELKDWLNSVNFTKENLRVGLEPRSNSGQKIKFPNLDKDLQYHFFLNTLRKRKRFSPWLRKDKVTDLEIIKQYYGYSNEKALSALKILTPDQINFIKQRLDIGGIR